MYLRESDADFLASLWSDFPHSSFPLSIYISIYIFKYGDTGAPRRRMNKPEVEIGLRNLRQCNHHENPSSPSVNLPEIMINVARQHCGRYLYNYHNELRLLKLSFFFSTLFVMDKLIFLLSHERINIVLYFLRGLTFMKSEWANPHGS